MSLHSHARSTARGILMIAAMVVFLSPYSETAQGQLRSDVPSPFLTTGTIVMDNAPRSQVGNWSNMLNMTMSHSYSVSFGSFGGHLQNLNAYTNHTRFQFSDRLSGQMDISLLHSPFGGSMLMAGQSQNALGARVVVQNASLTYKFSDRSTLSVHFSQNPIYGYGSYGVGGFGPGAYGAFARPGFGGAVPGFSPFGYPTYPGQP